MDQTVDFLKDKWESTYTGNVFDFFFLDEFFNKQYESDQKFGVLIGIFSLVAIALACFGLWGLTLFSSLQRSKEIAIRKVLGSSVMNVMTLLVKEYIVLILIALAIGLPLVYTSISQWLANYVVRIPLYWWLFVVPGPFMTLIALVTISYHTYKACSTNPVRFLRSE